MALTYRNVKGSALTIDELDENFSYFTGSHAITGSLYVSGSIIPLEASGTLGTADAPWKEIFVEGGTIYFISGSNSGSMGWSSGSGFTFGTDDLVISNRGGFTFQYSGSVVLNTSWSGGNPQQVISTDAAHITASGYNKWHFSDIPRTFTSQYHSNSNLSIFALLTASITDSDQVLVRIWDDENPKYEAFFVNSGSASITMIQAMVVI